ncbi:hypothetical protein AB838_09610 [Rhodobacteraceae bacterium (ex Bugula neritina AB1)]|nr:hypothetical protein AB838_09610 [Rhodobacteraceae bacterium (ex Bugula neritina AB1)]
MPSGYLVQLGNGSLDHGDTITSTYSSFTTDSSLGAGSWSWTGWVGGSYYSNEVETGAYYLAADGNVYFVPDLGSVDTLDSATAASPPSYTQSDGNIEGTAAGELIDNSYTDADGDQIDNGNGGGSSGNQDTVEAGAGNDTVRAGADDDLLLGGAGDDTMDGAAGDDTIYGDSSTEAGLGSFQQSITNANVTDTSSGFKVTAKDVSGTISAANIDYYDGAFGVAGAISDTDSGVTAQIGYDKASGVSEELIIEFDQATTDASFTFKHLFTSQHAEEGHWAVYNDGVLVAQGDFTEDTAGTGAGTVNINGYGDFDKLVLSANIQTDLTDGSDYTVSNITFNIPPEDPSAGDDTISGGLGDDVIYGQDGDDHLSGGEDNDSISGGSGSDTLFGGPGGDADTLDGGDGDDDLVFGSGDLAQGGTGDDRFFAYDSEGTGGTATVVGGEGDEDLTDATNGGSGDNLRLDWDGTGANVTDNYTVSMTGDEAGTVTGSDTDLNFSEIEIITTGDGADTIDLASDSSGMDVYSNAGADSVTGGSGADYVDAGTGDDTVTGGAGADTIEGGGGDDYLAGGSGGDSLTGGAGDDSLIFGEGDTASGGDGDDYFKVVDTGDSGSSNITITGGDTGQTTGDTLDLNGQVVQGSVNITDNTGGSLTGTAQLLDGSIVSFSGIEAIICFVAGTGIATHAGLRAIETLRPGDLVLTRDNGMQPVRWISQSTVPATGNLAPIRVKAGHLGAERDLLVSPQHRMLFSGSQASLLFGESEVLVSAVHMLNDRSIRREPGGTVTYVHVLFDQHEIIYAEGAASESFHPGVQAVSALEEPVREELFRIMPDLRWHSGEGGRTARLCASRHEAALLQPPPVPDQ